jgi:hypothetical protein
VGGGENRRSRGGASGGEEVVSVLVERNSHLKGQQGHEGHEDNGGREDSGAPPGSRAANNSGAARIGPFQNLLAPALFGVFVSKGVSFLTREPRVRGPRGILEEVYCC